MLRVLFCLLVSLPALSLADAESAPSPFYPTWKLLSAAEKQQFVAGYIQGWKDAARVTDVAISYVRDNPSHAVEGLQELKGLYDLSDLKPALLASAIDEYFRGAEHRNEGLSQAVSAAKRAVSGR